MCAAGTGYRAAHTHVRARLWGRGATGRVAPLAGPVPGRTGPGAPGTHEGALPAAYGPERAPSRGAPPRRYADAAAASAARARSARSTPARDSDTSRRSAAFGSAEASQASVASRVSWETWIAG